MAKGGVRPGAGRPHGSKSTWNFRDFCTAQQVSEVAQTALQKYKNDSKILVALLRYLFSEAPKEVNGNFNSKYIIEFKVYNLPALSSPKAGGDFARSAPLLGDSNWPQIRQNNSST